MDYKLAQKYAKAIEQLGFAKMKDVLGTYYTKGIHKISIMNHGNTWICYYNQFQTDRWVMLARTNAIMDYIEVLKWVHEKARNAL